MTKYRSCFFSGHRILEKKEAQLMKSLLREEILNKINDGVTRFIAGGAIGFDTLAAEQVIDIKQDYPQVQLVLYLPCKNHFARWGQKDVERFDEITKHADEIKYVYQGKYIPGCMQMRNNAMVKDSDCGIVYLANRMGSGSAQTASYAKEKGIPFVNIADEIKKYADCE
ncbi:MAG: DUF1273 family protein [Clostridia bacterium]|nr:DUF1273 family protein [Clostridia bacterium]